MSLYIGEYRLRRKEAVEMFKCSWCSSWRRWWGQVGAPFAEATALRLPLAAPALNVAKESPHLRQAYIAITGSETGQAGRVLHVCCCLLLETDFSALGNILIYVVDVFKSPWLMNAKDLEVWEHAIANSTLGATADYC